jgi:hypothetical protein
VEVIGISEKIEMSLFLGILLCLTSIPPAFAENDENSVSSNKTVTHEIIPTDYYAYLEQGESSSFTVSFKNNDNKALEIEPKIIPVSSSSDFDESWITISPANIKVDPDEVQEFTIEVSVPEDVSGGDYGVVIAFTDDIDIYSQLVNKMYLSITVPIQQKLELQTTYISDVVETGQEYEYTVKMKNVAAKDITIDPKITTYNPFNKFGLKDNEIEITAPSTLEPGEIADMVIRVPVPENATGTYDGYIDMNVEGDYYGYEPQLELYLTALQNPSIPYVKKFSTDTKDPITIEVSTNLYSSGSWIRNPPQNEIPSFELNMKHDSNSVNMSLVKTTQIGDVYIGSNTWSDEDDVTYEDSWGYYTETYTADGAIGDWELEILPKNMQYFGYAITVGDPNIKSVTALEEKAVKDDRT